MKWEGYLILDPELLFYYGIDIAPSKSFIALSKSFIVLWSRLLLARFGLGGTIPEPTEFGECFVVGTTRKLSTSGIYRLALYNRYVSVLDRRQDEYVSSQELAEATGHTAAQVRKDLTCYGSLGEPGKGYEIGKIDALLTKVFRKESFRNVVLVGVGNLGLALISYKGFSEQQFKIVAAFDRDVRKIGKYVEEVPIHDIQDLASIVSSTGTKTAIVCVPAQSAQRVVDELISAGVKAILNFAPAGRLKIPEGIALQNMDMSIELDRLYYLLRDWGGFRAIP